MIPIEGTVVALGDLIGEGKVGHIGLCEASPGAIRQAHAMQPVTAV
jgi:aryl-alcohol dehydrogenase-like predicted oxidoreductase